MNVVNERGFALPTTIFLVTILTVMLAAAFVRTSSDHQIADGSQFMEEALSIAQSGLQRYMEAASSRPADGDSTRINVTGGYAWVKVYSLQKPIDTLANETFVISSTGYVIKATQGSTPVAQRTVAQMAFWQIGFLTVPAALTATNNISNGGASRTYLYGNSYSPDTLGLRVRSNPSMTNMFIYGQPTATQTGGTAESIAIETGVDWQSVLDGDLECANSSIFSGRWNFTWDSYCIDGNLTLDKYYGLGLLVVTGDLTINGYGSWGFYWYGPILVGGVIRFQARPRSRIYGAVMSGLNEQIPALPAVGPTTLGVSGRDVQIYYVEDYVQVSLAYLTGLVPIEGTWMDNWATY